VRSQMAEGLCRAICDGNDEISSAGIAPIGVHPAAIASMREIDIDISGHTSRMLSRSMLDRADFVITLCNSAVMALPLILSRTQHIHWDIPNPDRNYDTEEERERGFARIRDMIEEKIREFLKETY